MHRFIFSKLKSHLTKKPITLLVGARQTGKTTLMYQLMEDLKAAKERTFFLTLEDSKILEQLNHHPEYLFQLIPPLDNTQKNFVFIDEIQYLNNPSNFLKYHYDLYRQNLKFIVSGSSGFYINDKFKDSLAGRKRIFNLPTFSFEEMLYFKNRTELIEYVNQEKIPRIYYVELIKLLQEYLLFGGYPDVVLEPSINEKKAIISEIANSYVKKDATEANMRHPEIYLNLMRIFAAQIGNILNLNNVGSNINMDRKTVDVYLRLMRMSFHITLVKPYFRNIPKEIRKMPKIYFNDLGLRNHFIKNFEAIALRQDRGELLENYVFRKFLDIYGEDEIKFWRTQKKQEVDFIIQEENAFEVKFSERYFKKSHYKYFIEKYPEIPLQLIHFDNILKMGFKID